MTGRNPQRVVTIWLRIGCNPMLRSAVSCHFDNRKHSANGAIHRLVCDSSSAGLGFESPAAHHFSSDVQPWCSLLVEDANRQGNRTTPGHFLYVEPSKGNVAGVARPTLSRWDEG